MQFTRIFVAILMLALVSSSAMASACATSCAIDEAMAKTMHTSPGTKNTVSAATNDHCHLGAMSGKQQSPSHKSCTMAGCHFSQATPLNPGLTNFFTEFSGAGLPQFNAFALSADLSPPIKPPA